MNRLAWTALLAALLVGPIAFTLSARVDDLRDAPLARGQSGWTPTPVPMAPDDSDPTLLRLTLYSRNLHAVLTRPEIDIGFATYGPTLELVRGMLYAGRCTYATPDGTRVENNTDIRFLRWDGCDPEEPPHAGAHGVDRLVLVMRLTRPAPLLVWTFTPTAPPDDPASIFVGAKPEAGRLTPVLRGRYVDVRRPSPLRRAYLLNYVWQLSGRSYWIAVVVGLAGLLFAAGGSAFVLAPGPGNRSGRPAAAAGAMALGLGLLYAVLVPPFQAPSEPDHLLAFADLAGRPDLSEDAAEWARLGHLERIKFHTDERFRPSDIGRPYSEAWDPGVFPMAMSRRSRVAQAFWSALAPSVRARRAPATLLILRLANTFVFALALTAGALLLGATRHRHAAVCAVGLLLVPTLPFFAMHVSDFAMLTSLFVVFACLLAALVLDAPNSHTLGLPMGLLCALLLAGGRSAAPMMAVAGAALLARAALGSAGDGSFRPSLRHAALFWLGAAAGATALPLLSSEEFSNGLFPGDATGVPDWFRVAAEAVRHRAWLLPSLLPAGILLEIAALGIRRLLRRLSIAQDAIRPICYALALAIVGVAAASAVVAMPTLQFFGPDARPPLRPLVWETLASALTSVRLTNPDYLLSTSFWGGFGWLDAIPPAWLVTALVAASGALAVLLFYGIGRRKDARRFVLTVALAAGAIAALIASAVSTYFLNRNLHGRYLIGLYLSCLAVVWAGALVPLGGDRLRDSRFPGLVRPAVVAICALVHGYALAFLLKRYF